MMSQHQPRTATTKTAEENWVLFRLARSFLRQGFGWDEAWRMAYFLMFGPLIESQTNE
jgi:hypothetical protein